jgi:hypothetical protein
MARQFRTPVAYRNRTMYYREGCQNGTRYRVDRTEAIWYCYSVCNELRSVNRGPAFSQNPGPVAIIAIYDPGRSWSARENFGNIALAGP